MLSMFISPDSLIDVIDKPTESLIALSLILVGFIAWIIYELKTAPLIGEDYARKIEKAEEDAART